MQECDLENRSVSDTFEIGNLLGQLYYVDVGAPVLLKAATKVPLRGKKWSATK